jgi:GT2 family glycosyltransferase
MLARSSFLEHVGLFDERFFTYYEDVDLAWRGRGLGWRYVFVPGAVARHLHAATTGGVGSASFRFHNERNRLVVVGKDASTAMARRVLAALVRDTGRMARRDLLDRPRHRRLPSVAALRERAAAVAGAAGLAPHALRHRRDRRRWTVPAEQIEALLTD